MKKRFFSILLLAAFLCSKDLQAQPAKDLSKCYPVVSVPYSVPDNDQQNFADVYFRFAWNDKAPYQIAIQFVNHAYASRKFKFAIKDVTSKKMVTLDKVHNTRFGTETLKPNSTGLIWSGPVDSTKDSFALRVWNSDGDEFDKEAISISDQQ
ncbi:MAG TPA: hypothetical protein VK859_05285 [bacterium]|jgi:hypothetical protein|nr:hypothetical protein [bacterium]